MTILDKQSIFTAMLQDGPFSVGELPPFINPFSKESKSWVRSLAGDQLLKTKYRAVRNQIFDFLGVAGYDEIVTLLHNQSRKRVT